MGSRPIAAWQPEDAPVTSTAPKVLGAKLKGTQTNTIFLNYWLKGRWTAAPRDVNKVANVIEAEKEGGRRAGSEGIGMAIRKRGEKEEK